MAGASGSNPRWGAAAPSTSPSQTWSSSPRSSRRPTSPRTDVTAEPPNGSVTPSWALEETLWREAHRRVAGIDEAGRGALAGPVVAAAVMLKPGRPYPYRDSKLLKAEEREALAREVLATAVAVGVGVASAREVDSLNVLNATHLAARRAIAAMVVAPDALVTDYLRIRSGLPELAVAKGESKSYQIAAASIVAKSARDALMLELDGRYPGYGFARHKGYGVKQHLRAIEELGATAQHRTSFAPVAARSSRALFPLGMRP